MPAKTKAQGFRELELGYVKKINRRGGRDACFFVLFVYVWRCPRTEQTEITAEQLF